MRMLQGWMLFLIGFGSAQPGRSEEVWLQQAAQHIGERLREQREDSLVDASRLAPLTIVSVSSEQSNYEHLISLLSNSLRQSLQTQVLVCERCMAAVIESGEQTIYENGFADLDKVRALYQDEAVKPKAAVWIQAGSRFLSIRIVILATGEVIYADTVDARLDWSSRSMRTFTRSRLRERQARGEPIIHTHWDIGLSPTGGSHIGWSLMQQWGSSNQYLSGLSLNLTDPTAGVGLNFFQIMSGLRKTALGGKLLVSVPRLVSRAASAKDAESSGFEDLTLVLMAKLPLFEPPEKFYAHVFFSTNGYFGFGLTF
ncbi:hypothetical protein [Oligoflexus tunisiensis]|uniref:hypothetical protein n=1 Tax=Oligoflexus tunisiensis TaxID=708132 RepID=UPI00114CE020|nr:hypothetical protein [Oligoflexus tunisiensis]